MTAITLPGVAPRGNRLTSPRKKPCGQPMPVGQSGRPLEDILSEHALSTTRESSHV